MIADHLGGANKKADAATPEDSSAVRQKGDAMSEIKRYLFKQTTPDDKAGYMFLNSHGHWVRYEDHQAEIGRLTAERDEAQAEVERLKAMLPPTAHTGVRNGPGAGSWSVFAEKVVEERDAARAEMERVKAERDESDWKLGIRRKDSSDQFRTALTLRAERTNAQAEVERLTAERDMARAEVRRLIAERDQMATHPRGREVGRFGLDGHYLYAMEPTRPTDEDIWREAFMVLLRKTSYAWERTSEEADRVLAVYRKRWPR